MYMNRHKPQSFQKKCANVAGIHSLTQVIQRRRLRLLICPLCKILKPSQLYG